jgi:outer membrane receptor protein involved in Fe transport
MHGIGTERLPNMGRPTSSFVTRATRSLVTLLALSAFVAHGTVARGEPATPQPSGTVDGHIIGDGGAPIAGALLTLHSGSTVVSSRSDERGEATILGIKPGTYLVEVDAAGYAVLSDRTIDVKAGETTAFTAQMYRNAASLVTLGRITTRAGEALSTASVPSESLGAQTSAAAGYPSVADMIAQYALSAAVIRPSGGGEALPAVVALRGPDPTETLVDVDGQAVNSGISGSFDLTLLDPSALADVQLVYGIAPSSLVGPNTIDGAINIRTLDPTLQQHGLIRLSFGSFGAFGATVQGTGTSGAVGYAVSLHRTTTQGEVNRSIVTSDGSTALVGSSVDGSTGMGKVRYSFDRGLGSAELTVRDQSSFRDLSAGLTSLSPATGIFDSFAGSAALAHNAGYGLDVSLPVGRLSSSGGAISTLSIDHLTSIADQSVFGPASGTSPYLDDDRDLQTDDSAELDRALGRGTLSLKVDLREETLRMLPLVSNTQDQSIVRRLDAMPSGHGASAVTNASSLGLSQVQRSAAARYTIDPTSNLHYSAALYFSDFSSFGSSLDPRLGFVWTPTAATAVRASVGTTFQAPQLPELFVPSVLPPPDSTGFIDIGNPDLKADHATDFDLGSDHMLSGPIPTRVSFDAYRTDLRTPAQRYFPPVNCLQNPPPPPTACESFPINVGGAVYQGLELRTQSRLDDVTTARLSYTINSAFATSVSPAFQNGTIVVGEQSQGVPLHSAGASVSREIARGFSFDLSARYEDAYNELHRPQYASFDAGLTWRGGAYEVGISGRNLTGVYDDGFTLAGAGVPYGGIEGPIPSDAYSLQGRSITLSLTRTL